MLAATYLETADWARATQVADTLRRIGSTQTVRAADQLQSQIIARRQGQDQAIAFLEGLIESEGSSDDLRLGLLRSRLASGQREKAVNLAEELVAEFPDNPRIRFLLGNTHIAVSDYVAAAEVFESFIADFPQSEPAWVQLSRSLNAQGDGQSARRIVERGLEAIPGAPNLLWAKASFMETDNDIDGAIEIYEQLYERNSNSAVVANNLASLLATYREDDASLERAFTVGRRLRGTDVAPFQDTYGWILHRRGEFEEAVTYLEPAAEALSTDPIVQYHLAMTYLELGRTEDAKAKFERVIEIAGSNDPRPQIERAAAEIERLAAAQVTD
jgi:tetratricopeptide (TPR) repeat protein